MNTRSKYINIGNTPISLKRVFKYIQLNNIYPESIAIESLLDTNILQHWSKNPYSIRNGILLYDTFSIRELSSMLKTMDKVDMNVPVLLMDDRLIDGVHRVLKCHLSGILEIKAYRLTTMDFVNIIKRKYKR